MANNTYVALDKQTVTSAVSSVTFNTFGSTYTDLVIVSSPIVTSATTFAVRFNSDSTSTFYSSTIVSGDGTTATSTRVSTQNEIRISYGATSRSTNTSNIITQIQNYSNATTYKTLLSRDNAASDGTGAIVGLWRNTAAITSITIIPLTGGSIINTGSTFSLYGIKSETTAVAPKATGGAIYSDSLYYYHSFGASGTFAPLQSLTVDALIVAGGGGGGGANAGGGGGAGGLVYRTGLSATVQNYTVTVGAGGTGQIPQTGGGSNGGDSSALSYTATGGGTGGYWNNSSTRNGVAGGSGGGGGETGGPGTAGASNQNTYSGTGFGNAGGAPYVSGGDIRTGGGGGAGAVGGAGVAAGNAGSGGIGKYYDDFGAATGSGEYASEHYYYAGGGGGSQYANGQLTGLGGLGGGGRGGQGSVSNDAVKGMVNTGGGGGGAGYQNANDTTRVNGGSGIVIIRYLKA